MEKNKKKLKDNNMDDIETTGTVEEVAGTSGPDEAKNLVADESEKLKAELDEQKDKYIRLVAEFENYKRRTSKERIELIQTAGREVIVSLLDVLDDCDRAEKQLQDSNNLDQIKEGVLLVFNKLRKTLQMKGLKAMESLNTEFDVEKHEAITEVPVADEKMRGKVVDEIQKGYYLNDKLIRFAKVVVGK